MKYFVIASLLSLMIACSSTVEDESMLEKYVFDNLEEISSIANWRLNEWNVIDTRSLTVQTGPGRYYLLVLSRPISELPFTENILISSTAGKVRAGIDTVSSIRNPTISAIERIYKLKGKEQVNYVTQQITAD